MRDLARRNFLEKIGMTSLCRFGLSFSVLLFYSFCVFSSSVMAAAPVKRIAYLEAGHFWLYDKTWRAFQVALAAKSDMLYDYPSNAKFSPGWEAGNMAKLPEVAAALMKRKDIDLVVGMGTAAVKALLAANTGEIPILGMGMADPLASNVISSVTDSGVDNFTCRITPDRWSTMFRVFYDVVQFKKLGILYQDTAEGRVYSSLNDAYAVANELGFSLLGYGELSSEESPTECLRGLEELKRQGMDAFFIGPLNCFDWQSHDVAPLMDKLTLWKTPTFARDGSDFVKAGALLGFSTWNFDSIGEFLAQQSHAVLKGTLPRRLSMEDRFEPSIAVNLETARRIDFIFPLDVLVAADELFPEIIQPAYPAK